MPYYPIQGFAPDAPLDEPGTIRNVTTGGFIPTLRGIAAVPGDADSGISAAPSNVASAVSVELNDGTNRLIIGTEGGGDTSILYQNDSVNWTEVSSDAEGNSYSATADARWTFAVYNDEIFAAQKGATLQGSVSSEFTAVTGAPKFSIVEGVLDFIIGFDADDGGGTYGNDPNRWWCCAAGDPHSWTADIGTQATTGLLTDSPGAIRAAKRLGSNIVAYKNTSMYLGQYINAPLVWGWTLVPGEGLGTWSPYSVVDVEGVGHLFIGYDNFYIFDGNRAIPIGDNRVAQFFFDEMNVEKARRIVGFHDRFSSIVYWWYPSTAFTDGRLDRFIAYNYRSQRWGFGIKRIQFAFNYLEPGITYNSLGTFYTNYADLPNASYDTAFGSTSTFKPGIFDNDKNLRKFEGVSGTNDFETNFFGTDDSIQLVDRFRPRFHKAPSTGRGEHLITDTLGSAGSTVTASINYARGVFDSVHAGRWHKFKIEFTGDFELLGVDLRIKPDSLE